MKKNTPHKICLSLLFIITCLCIFSPNVRAALPSPWLNQDVGPAVAGSADFASGQFTINAKGQEISGIADTFHFVYQSFTGDVEIIAKVNDLGALASPKAGIMIRESFSMGAKNVFVGITKNSNAMFQRRTASNGTTTIVNGPTVVTAPYWVKLVRRGNNFSAYQSPDGAVWTQIGTTISATLTSNVYVGIGATSRNNTTNNTHIFSNVSVRAAVPPSAPVLNSATAGVSQVDLSWSSSSTATSYKVKYGTVSGTYPNTITLGNVITTSITNLNNGTPYYFVVTASNDYGESSNSNQLSSTPVDAPTVFINKIDYNAMGQKTRIEYGNGVVTTNTYDPLNLRLKRIYTVKGLTILQDLNYTYDSAGNILSITDAVNTASQTFQYDALNRLTQANGSYGTKNYQYDQIGNIVQKDGKIYSYGGSGGGIHAVTALSDGTIFTYDANGNMATKQKGADLYNYIYDTENRLIQLKKNNVVTASYEYDGDGGRVKKTIGSTVTKYVGSLYEETNGVRTRHIFIDDMKIASITNAQIMYYHGDHLGGTNVLTDKLGVKKELMEYEPFGSFARHDKYGTGAEVAQFYFTGQRFDEESGLYYYGARYYDPSLGRFITADSIVQNPTDPQTLNRYSYTGNNPVNRIDVDGHKWSWKSFFGAVVGAVIGVVTAGIAAPIISSAFAGLSAGSVGAISGAFGGMVGGAAAAGISGGNILQGALFGGVLGSVAGWAGGINNGLGNTILGGMLLGSIGVAAATDSWDSLAGGLVGGAIGLRLNSFLLAHPSPAESSNYQHLSSDEIPDPIDNLTRAFNNVKTGPIEKSAIVQALVETVNEPGLIDVSFSDFFAVATLFEGGVALKGAAALGREFISSVNSFSLKLGNAGFARIGGGFSDTKQITQIAKQLNMSPALRREFGQYVESMKEVLNRPNNSKFTFNELKELGKDFIATYGK